jgi:hypothetical protein
LALTEQTLDSTIAGSTIVGTLSLYFPEPAFTKIGTLGAAAVGLTALSLKSQLSELG